jgi:hypothetical protein
MTLAFSFLETKKAPGTKPGGLFSNTRKADHALAVMPFSVTSA